MKLAEPSHPMRPQARISKGAYLLGCLITIALWGLVLFLAAVIA